MQRDAGARVAAALGAAMQRDAGARIVAALGAAMQRDAGAHVVTTLRSHCCDVGALQLALLRRYGAAV